MAGKKNIAELPVPIEILSRSNGFAIDMGKWLWVGERICDILKRKGGKEDSFVSYWISGSLKFISGIINFLFKQPSIIT